MDFVDRMRTLVVDMPRVIRGYEWNILCDGIEAKCERLVEEARSESEGMRGFCGRLEEAAKKHEDVTIFGVDYMALPVDADGVAIRPGDVIDGYGGTSEVASLRLTRDCGGFRWFINTDNDYTWSDSYAFTHHKEQDVTDVLREFALACEDAGNAGPEVERIAAEYAEKLQIKGE